MAVTAKFFGKGPLHLVSGAADWDTDTFNASLHLAAWTPDQDANDYFDDATNEVAAGSGYTAGGVALASKTVTYDSATNEVRLDCADPTFPLSGAKTFRYSAIRKARGGAASADELIGWVDFGSDQTVSVPWTIVIASDGLFKGVVA